MNQSPLGQFYPLASLLKARSKLRAGFCFSGARTRRVTWPDGTVKSAIVCYIVETYDATRDYFRRADKNE